MSDAVINSVIAAAEDRIEYLTGKRVTLCCTEQANVRPPSHLHFMYKQCTRALEIDEYYLATTYRGEINNAMRHAIVYVLKTAIPKASWSSIGKLFNRDHVTTLKSYRVGKNLLSINDHLFMGFYEKLQPLLP